MKFRTFIGTILMLGLWQYGEALAQTALTPKAYPPAPPPPVSQPSAFSLHGNVGWVFVEEWLRDEAPALDQMRPVLVLNAYLGSRYFQPSYGGLSLGGQLMWDYRTGKGETGRLGYLGLVYEW